MKHHIVYHRSTRGLSVVEVAIGVSIAALVMVYASYAIVRAASFGRENLAQARAVLLAEEGIELIRFLRDDSWTTLSSMQNGAVYAFSVSTTTIATTTTVALIDNTYQRTVTVFPAYRATSGDDLVASTSGASKVIDADTKLATVTVSWWSGVATSSLALSTYLTNI